MDDIAILDISRKIEGDISGKVLLGAAVVIVILAGNECNSRQGHADYSETAK